MESINLLRNRISEEVHEMLSPTTKTETLNQSMPLYGKIYDVLYLDKHIIIKGDLFTQNLIKYDKKLSEVYALSDKLCKPIFFGFEAKMTIREFLKKFPIKKILDSNNCASLCYKKCNPLILTIKRNDNSDHSYKKSEIFEKEVMDFIDKLNDVLYSCAFDVIFVENWGIWSKIFFSASPFILYSKRIRFKLSQNQKSIDKSLPQSFVLPELQSCIFRPNLNCNNLKLNIYNVGQGNFSTVCNDDKPLFVFDVGFTYHESHTSRNFTDVIVEIEKIKTKYYIISHFDLDHILGCIYLNDDQFNKDISWIIRDPNEVAQLSASAKRFLMYIISSCNVCVVKKHTLTPLNLDSKKQFILYKGDGKGKSKGEKNNSLGLKVLIESPKTALLTGDCLYNHFDSKLSKQNLDILAVPHHGCKVDDLTQISNHVLAKSDATAIISVGKNTYSHPDSNHISELSYLGFNIEKTMDFKTSHKTYDLF